MNISSKKRNVAKTLTRLSPEAVESIKSVARKITTKASVGLVHLVSSDTQSTLEAAQALAQSMNQPLLRIDLSQVISKWVGETEKNLETVFGDARSSGSILLFDEADALFGKRSDVKDSHDRYANTEVDYLLQQIESYDGIAIIATKPGTVLSAKDADNSIRLPKWPPS